MKKVFVGLSGGVDSSVSALLLKQGGYDVTGVFIKAWHPDFLPCNWRAEMRDAMRVCAKLEIPFLMCDLEKEYKKEVIDYLIDEYSKGRTPNPDVMCNKQIKFGGFLEFAEKHGAEYVATGHYAQKIEKNGKFLMLNSVDTEKDQTYFLWTISQEKLSRVLFPIGHLQKSKVRTIAEKYGLHTSTKKDSQGLCFVGHVDIKNFLRRYIKTSTGPVLNLSGEVIGEHDGAELYTIGERHGFRINNGEIISKPHYTVSKDLSKNTITVSDIEQQKNSVSGVMIGAVNFINDNFSSDEEITAMIRYRGHKIPGYFSKDVRNTFNFKDKIESVSVGQSIVFYKNGECLGGGIISETL